MCQILCKISCSQCFGMHTRTKRTKTVCLRPHYVGRRHKNYGIINIDPCRTGDQQSDQLELKRYQKSDHDATWFISRAKPPVNQTDKNNKEQHVCTACHGYARCSEISKYMDVTVDILYNPKSLTTTVSIYTISPWTRTNLAAINSQYKIRSAEFRHSAKI